MGIDLHDPDAAVSQLLALRPNWDGLGALPLWPTHAAPLAQFLSRIPSDIRDHAHLIPTPEGNAILTVPGPDGIVSAWVDDEILIGDYMVVSWQVEGFDEGVVRWAPRNASIAFSMLADAVFDRTED